MFLDFLSIDIDGLLAHDGFEVQGDITARTFLGQSEMLAVPSYALIVTTAAGFGGHQLYGMRCRYHIPAFVVEILGLSTCCIAQMEAPSSIEVPYQPAAVLQREEAGNGGASPRPLQREGEN